MALASAVAAVAHIRRGASENILRAQCYADRCRFFVNAEFAFEVDGIPAQGRVGRLYGAPLMEQPGRPIPGVARWK